MIVLKFDPHVASFCLEVSNKLLHFFAIKKILMELFYILIDDLLLIVPFNLDSVTNTYQGNFILHLLLHGVLF